MEATIQLPAVLFGFKYECKNDHSCDYTDSLLYLRADNCRARMEQLAEELKKEAQACDPGIRVHIEFTLDPVPTYKLYEVARQTRLTWLPGPEDVPVEVITRVEFELHC